MDLLSQFDSVFEIPAPDVAAVGDMVADAAVDKNPQSLLYKYAQTRLRIAELGQEADKLEPEATSEALDIADSDRAVNGKRVVYSDFQLQITLCFRNKYLSEKEDEVLARIAESIKIAQIAQAGKVSQELEEITAQIDQLNDLIEELKQKQDELLSTPYISSLKKRYKERYDLMAYQVPSLSVMLKRKR